MQAIIVKYLGPTDTKGTRIKATCAAGSVTHSRDYSMEVSQQSKLVVEALLDKLGWKN